MYEKKIIILGNGPSIKKFQFKSIKNSFVIGTNNLIYSKIFSQNKNHIYTAYDPSFFKKKNINWINAINRSKCKIYFSKKNKILISKKLKIKINDFDLLIKNKFVKRFIKIFSNKKKLMSTVIIERAIPIAIDLAIKNEISHIKLYGCEFNYFLKKNGNLSNKSYFYGKNNNFFEHTKVSADKWREFNVNQFKKIKVFLNNFEVFISDKTPNGSLNFLNY